MPDATQLAAYIIGGVIILAGFLYAIYDNCFSNTKKDHDESLPSDNNSKQHS